MTDIDIDIDIDIDSLPIPILSMCPREWSMKRMMASASCLAEHGPVILWSISSRIPLLFYYDSLTISLELDYRSCNIRLLRYSAFIKSHNSKHITCPVYHLPPTSPNLPRQALRARAPPWEMTQTNEQSTTGRPSNPNTLCIEACKADDVSLMEQAISMASEPNSRHAVQVVVQWGLSRSARRRAVHVLSYLVDHPHGADVAAISAPEIVSNDDMGKHSQEVLEILVAHGWDINTRGTGDATRWPLLWHVVEYPDLVRWCLDHGARVDIPDNPPRVNGNVESRSGVRRPTILGAASGSVETFELLRAKGAPLDPRTLHCAVEQATVLAPEEGEEPSPFYTQRMGMVRHLVDVVKLDVNAKKRQLGSSCSTPLFIVAGRHTDQRYRELINFLLDCGADPNLNCRTQEDIYCQSSAIACAETCRNIHFLQAVKDWQAEKQGE